MLVRYDYILFPSGNPCPLCWRHHSISAAGGGDAERVLQGPQDDITRGLEVEGVEVTQLLS